MKISRFEPVSIALPIIRWTAIAAVVGFLSGTASWAFLRSLEWVTDYRESHRWLIALLPVAGFVMGWIYLKHGRDVEKGNDLLIDEIHDPKNVVPFRMTPLIFLATVGTHLFGGSAGREGTAVQMGGSLADRLTGPLKLEGADRRILLMAGISAGFGSVFGTPLAGAIFGLEVLEIGRVRYEAIWPCFVASIVGNQVTRMWGIHHAHVDPFFIPGISAETLLLVAAAGIAFGLTAMAFASWMHKTMDYFREHISQAPMRPVVGGALIALAVAATHSTRYIGLGIPTLAECFVTLVHPWDFLAKMIFTVVTLGSGFKGGEVTPLFFIGATLGNALSRVLILPSAFLSALGLVAVFAGAANTPIASTLLAIELYGSPIGVFAAVACVVSYLFSGHAGIYHSQRVGYEKHGKSEPKRPTIADRHS